VQYQLLSIWSSSPLAEGDEECIATVINAFKRYGIAMHKIEVAKTNDANQVISSDHFLKHVYKPKSKEKESV
jgi:hypothetical protein